MQLEKIFGSVFVADAKELDGLLVTNRKCMQPMLTAISSFVRRSWKNNVLMVEWQTHQAENLGP